MPKNYITSNPLDISLIEIPSSVYYSASSSPNLGGGGVGNETGRTYQTTVLRIPFEAISFKITSKVSGEWDSWQICGCNLGPVRGKTVYWYPCNEDASDGLYLKLRLGQHYTSTLFKMVSKTFSCTHFWTCIAISMRYKGQQKQKPVRMFK